MSETLWRIAVTVPATAAAAFERALEPFATAISVIDAGGGGRHGAAAWVDWKADLWLAETCIIEALASEQPDRAALTAALAMAGASAGVAAPDALVEILAARDWVAETQRLRHAVTAGRFHVRTSAMARTGLPGRIELVIDTGLAFGTGEHATTQCCLRALDWLRRRHPIARALDMGTGTGIIAIAMARAWHAPVVAADIDPAAVRVARANVRVNRVGQLVRVVESQGYAARPVGERRPYDLIAANILAGPLIRQAPALARHLRPGGLAVLAGFLAWQERAVLAAQRRQGLRPVRRFRQGDWGALVVRR